MKQPRERSENVGRRVLGRLGCGAGLLLLVGLASLVGVVPPTALRLVDEDGAPVRGAYAACYYSGYRFNFVDTIPYDRPGAIVRSDGSGRLSLPFRLYTKGPLDTYAVPHVLLLYAPELHLARRLWSLSDSHAEERDVRIRGSTLALRDLEDDPEAWERSLQELHAFTRYDLVRSLESPEEAKLRATMAIARELAQHLRAEVEAFVRRHGPSPRRPRPLSPHLESRPLEEQREVRARIQEDLAREPEWGPWVARRWGPRLEELERTLARLP